MKRTLLILAILIVSFFSNRFSLSKPVEISKEATSSAISRVVRVVDGDTIEIEGGQRVRYIGMDSPEIDKCFSAEAKAANEKFVSGKTVRLEKDVSETDKYDRLLRYVYVDPPRVDDASSRVEAGNVLINDVLVRQGFARAEPVKPDLRYADQFWTAQQEAKANSRGLWNACSPK